MAVTFGADYSEHEHTPAELDRVPDYDLHFLIRYIGYPHNVKCISHYPGAYKAHVAAGRLVLLVAENLAKDALRGHANGVKMARNALEDANSLGYPDHLPIFFAADGPLDYLGIPVATAMAYLDGAASVLGQARTGAYGFYDFVKAAHAGGHAKWTWLAGIEPEETALATQGWPHFYQWNNGKINIAGEVADLDVAYSGVLESLGFRVPATTGVPPWPLLPGQYFGLFSGPALARGGYHVTDQPRIKLIQQALIRKGFAPGATASGVTGKYTEPTLEAVKRFQQAGGRPQTGIITAPDWKRLLA
jgi:hypothetical protein